MLIVQLYARLEGIWGLCSDESGSITRCGDAIDVFLALWLVHCKCADVDLFIAISTNIEIETVCSSGTQCIWTPAKDPFVKIDLDLQSCWKSFNYSEWKNGVVIRIFIFDHPFVTAEHDEVCMNMSKLHFITSMYFEHGDFVKCWRNSQVKSWCSFKLNLHNVDVACVFSIFSGFGVFVWTFHS